MITIGTPAEGGSWLRKWFGRHGPGNAKALQALLTRTCQPETTLAFHLAERDRQNTHAVAHETGCGTTRTAAAAPARRADTQTAAKRIQDSEATQDLHALYRQPGG